MNHDDPKLTAYALDTLPENERANIEALLKEQPSAAAELAETREIAGVMRGLFKSELTETLPPRRREAILQAAIDARTPAVNTAPTNIIEPHVSWWRRAVVWQAAAACAVFGFGIYAISVTLSNPADKSRKPLAGQPNGIEVKIDGLLANQNGVSSPSEAGGIATPPEGNPGKVNGLAGTPVTPKVNPIVPKTNDLNPLLANGIPVPQPRKPEVVGSNEPDNREFIPAHADSAPAARRPGNQAIAEVASPKAPSFAAVNPGDRMVLTTDSGELPLTAEESSRYYAMREYFNDRWQEAVSIREGSTYGDLARYFRRDGGSTPRDSYRFVMIKCPFIKVDVAFAAEDGQSVTWPVSPDTRIRTITRPVFEPEQGK